MLREFTAVVVDDGRTVEDLLAEARAATVIELELSGLRAVSAPRAGLGTDGRVHVRVGAAPVVVVADRLRSHRAHILAANAAARAGRSLVDKPTCAAAGCDLNAGRSGLCTTHRTARNHARKVAS